MIISVPLPHHPLELSHLPTNSTSCSFSHKANHKTNFKRVRVCFALVNFSCAWAYPRLLLLYLVTFLYSKMIFPFSTDINCHWLLRWGAGGEEGLCIYVPSSVLGVLSGLTTATSPCVQLRHYSQTSLCLWSRHLPLTLPSSVSIPEPWEEHAAPEPWEEHPAVSYFVLIDQLWVHANFPLPGEEPSLMRFEIPSLWARCS